MSRLRSITAIASAAAMLGCASVAPDRTTTPTGLLVQPLQTVRHGMDADAHYRTGRYFQGQGRLELAADAYRRALVEQPSHVDALNALGVVHSLQQRPQQAEQAFGLALQTDPRAAHVRNNLGYHLLRNGRDAEALAVFEKASEIDPHNSNTLANLAAARARMGLPDERLAAAAPPETPAPTMAATPVTHATPPAAANSGAGPAVMASAAPASRVEVANGNGTPGLARLIAGLLAPASAIRPRLTNDKPFGVQGSRIQYVAGAQRLAEDINARMPAPLPLDPVASLERDVRVRVLLGKDFRQGSSAAHLDVPAHPDLIAAK